MNEPLVVNFGCRLNAFESDKIEQIARKYGLSDYIVVNTCAVTGEAERQVRQHIRKLNKEHPTRKIVLTGCAATYSPDEYSKMPGVVAIIENDKKLDAHEYLKLDSQDVVLPKKIHKNVRRFVQIQNGCDNHCTYCIVRLTRGSSYSYPSNAILNDVRQTIDEHPFAGPCEIVLTGVNISSYDDSGLKLADLAAYLIENEPRLTRLRFSSLDPADIDDHFIQIFAADDRIMPHLHLSIQSGDNMILKRMRRNHSREQIIEITDNVLSARPETIIGADFITGFPTESEEMFENTYKLIEDARIHLTHVFPYSERPGTPASLMPQVIKSERKNRAKRLIQESDNYLKKKLESIIGTQINVLAEGDFYGKTDSFLPVHTATSMDIGQIYTGEVSRVEDNMLIVEAI